MDELLNNDELRKYHQNGGRNGDKALIAVNNKGTLRINWVKLSLRPVPSTKISLISFQLCKLPKMQL